VSLDMQTEGLQMFFWVSEVKEQPREDRKRTSDSLLQNNVKTCHFNFGVRGRDETKKIHNVFGDGLIKVILCPKKKKAKLFWGVHN